jgi:beta-xylosidase/AraC-like DNA-binding protein
MMPNTVAQPRRAKTDITGAWIYHPAKPLVHSVLDLEIVFILEGELTIRIGPELRRLKQPDILLLKPQETFQKIPAPPQPARLSPIGDCFFLLGRIGSLFLSSVFGDMVPVFDCDSVLQNKDFGSLRSILAEIASADTVNSSNRLLFHSRLYRLLDELTARFVKPGDAIAGEEGDDGIRRQAIHRYIKENFRFPISLDELADFLSLSPQYLSRYFKKLFGVNFHTYLTRFRLENALKELSATDNPVTAIAHDNGFPNLTAFIKELKGELGQTPTAYRKFHRNLPEDPESTEEKGTTIDPSQMRDKLAVFMNEKTGPSVGRKNITVDAREGIPLVRPWQKIINLGFATDFEKSEFVSQIAFIQNKAPFHYARFQGLFGRSLLVSSGTEYGFSRIDRIIDFLNSVNLIPFIELGFKPNKINRDTDSFLFSNDDEMKGIPADDFEKLIANFLKHAINRYGIQEVNRWCFEWWIPTDEENNISEEQIKKYVGTFGKLRKVIKDLVPAALVGGPGIVTGKISIIDALKKILYSLKMDNSIPDFISFYLFGHSHIIVEGKDKSILWDKDEIPKRIEWIRECAETLNIGCHELSNSLFFVTEWNIDYSCRNMIHDSLLKAPYILQNAIYSIDCVGALSYWLASDSSTEYTDSDAPLFGGAGLISRHGIQKPALFAFEFLSKLGERLILKGDGHIVTAKSENEFVAILFNYKYLSHRSRILEQYRNMKGDISCFLEDTEPCAFSLEIKNISPGRYKVRQYILNSHHGSIYDAWLRLSAIANPQISEIEWLERTCFPALQIDFLEGKESLAIDCDLEPNEVRLLEITRILQ